jgi:hypothetical protein
VPRTAGAEIHTSVAPAAALAYLAALNGAFASVRELSRPGAGRVDPTRCTTVVVWCETFGQFITAAKYR